MNKKLIFISILIVAGLLASMLGPVTAAQHAKRIIEVNVLGLVYVYDEFPSVGEKTAVRFPRELVKNLVNYVSPNDPEPELEIDNDTFSIIVDSRPGEAVRLTTVFRGVVSWDPLRRNFELRFPLNPIIQYEERLSFYLEVRFPGEASEVSPGFLKQVSTGVFSGTVDDLDLSREKVGELSVTFTSQVLRIIEISSTKLNVRPFEREIGMDLLIRHLGGESSSEVTLKLPENSYGVEARDHLGKLSIGYDARTGRVTVGLRQSLDYNENSFISVRFKVPENSSLIVFEGDGVTITPFLPLNTTSWIYGVEVVMVGAEPESWSPEPEEVHSEYPDKRILTYQFSHIDPVNIGNNRISIVYKRVIAASAVLPYLAAASIAGLLGSITAVYVKAARAAPRRERIPIQELIRKVELLMPIYQGLSELISSGKIFERGYSRRALLEFKSSIKRHVDDVVKSAKELRGAAPEISGNLIDLENAAREFQKTVEKAWDIAYPYLSGGLSKGRLSERLRDYYDELKSSYARLAECVDSIRNKLG